MAQGWITPEPELEPPGAQHVRPASATSTLVTADAPHGVGTALRTSSRGDRAATLFVGDRDLRSRDTSVRNVVLGMSSPRFQREDR
jgi:hypothetical protein